MLKCVSQVVRPLGTPDTHLWRSTQAPKCPALASLDLQPHGLVFTAQVPIGSGLLKDLGIRTQELRQESGIKLGPLNPKQQQPWTRNPNSEQSLSLTAPEPRNHESGA